MNDITPVVDPTVVDTKHYLVAFDKDGNEVRVLVNADGSFAQDVEDEAVPATVH